VNFSSIFPQDLYSERLIDRLAYAHDASLYRVVPKAIIRPRNENDIIDLLHSANENHIPVTFRSAGTSLSGQSIGPGIIAETVRDWKQIKY
jgi:D-lactate dehydrogenase